jgi:hypothetical protein
MKSKNFKTVVLSLMVAVLCYSFAQPPKWVNLGSRTVNWSADRDVIHVSGAKGSYNSIKLFVDKAPVEFVKVTIHFANGADQNVELKGRIPAGGETRVIDINGKNRVIKKVTFFYKTSKPAPRGKAIVTLFGRQ